MARLSIAVFALVALAAAVSAHGPPPPAGPKGPAPAPAGGLKAWVQGKEAQLKQWAGLEKAKIQTAWKENVVPKIHEIQGKLGAQWQQKAPKLAALLKAKAGAAFEKAVQFVNKQLPQGQPPKKP